MEKLSTEILVHLSHSHQQLARTLEAKRHVVMRMAELVHSLPDVQPQLNGLDGLLEQSSQVTKSVIAYLVSLADLEEALADSLSSVLKAAGKSEGDEE